MASPPMKIEATSPSVIKKIARILQQFLEPNFKLKSDLYIHEFLVYFVDKNGDEKTVRKPIETELQELFCQWLISFSRILSENEKWNPPVEILSFALFLASELSSDEQIFVKLNCHNIFEFLVGFSKGNLSKDHSIKQSFVHLLSSFLEHKSGVQWVISTSFWINVISIGLKAPVYVRKNAYHFVVKLLEKTISFNRNFASKLVKLLVKPLKDSLRCLPAEGDVQDGKLFRSLKPCLNLLEEVTGVLLKNFNKQVFVLFLEHETLEMVEQIHLHTQEDEFCDELIKIRLIFIFYKLCVKVEGAKVVAHDSPVLTELKLMGDLMQHDMLKGNVRCVIKMCNYAHGLYCDVEPHMPVYVRKGEVLEFQNQMILFQIMPILVFSMQCYPQAVKSTVLTNDDFRNRFIQKLVKMAAVRIIELCSRFKVVLEPKDDLVEDASFSLKFLLKRKKLLTKERAATLFPALVYSLKDAVNYMRQGAHKDFVSRCTPFLGGLVDTIVDLVESFDLTWKDTIEIIWVLNLSCDILEYPNWNDKTMIVQGLKLLNTSISRYMSPDMVLLMYSTKDSQISNTGSLLYGNCHDTLWKIRDSALKVVYTMALNANTKFPALTSVLLEAKLPQLVVKMALKDGHRFVRATAFRCLQELIQIQEIWDELSDDMFFDIILNVFNIESEGVVRQEAAHLIYKIYRYQSFPDYIKPRLYDVMTYAALRDPHWEVKYNSLDFWFYMWCIDLENQGMIDRTFPTHTFSKEQKKIVVLNESEVRKRIIKVLNDLSKCGCLYVIKWAIQEDQNREVAKKATEFGAKILKMFVYYKVPVENVDISEPTFSYSPITDITDPLSHSTMSSNYSSSKSSSSMSPSSVENPKDMDNTQFSNSPFFNTLSPLTIDDSPLDLDAVIPFSVLSKQPPIPANQETAAPNPGPSTGSATVPTASHVLMNIDEICDVFDYDMLGDDSFMYNRVENREISNPLSVDHVMNSVPSSNSVVAAHNNVAVQQKMYSPIYQAQNAVVQINTNTYLAPSLFLKFMYNELDKYKLQQTTKNSMEKFEALLDNILLEYNIDSINID